MLDISNRLLRADIPNVYIDVPKLDVTAVGSMMFEEPDWDKLKSFSYAFEAKPAARCVRRAERRERNRGRSVSARFASRFLDISRVVAQVIMEAHDREAGRLD